MGLPELNFNRFGESDLPGDGTMVFVEDREKQHPQLTSLVASEFGVGR